MATGALSSRLVRLCLGPVLCPFSTPCQIITPLLEIAIWLPNPNPTPNPNPSPTPNRKPTNTRGVIIWQGSELSTTPALICGQDTTTWISGICKADCFVCVCVCVCIVRCELQLTGWIYYIPLYKSCVIVIINKTISSEMSWTNRSVWLDRLPC